MKLPSIPTGKTVYLMCHSCLQFQPTDESNLKSSKSLGKDFIEYICPDCNILNIVLKSQIAYSEEAAYISAIIFYQKLDELNQSKFNDLMDQYSSTVKKIGLANSLIYTMEKYFYDIIELLEAKDYSGVHNEAMDGLNFIESQKGDISEKRK